MKIKVTVCELSNEPEELEHGWRQLVDHVKEAGSGLVVLPEMPFAPWFAITRQFDLSTWQAAVGEHEKWLTRLQELAPANVISTRPANYEDCRQNEGFLWTPEKGYQAVHNKYYLPDEEKFWEASWYQRGTGEFVPVQAGPASVGMLICTELWSMNEAQAYGQAGVHLIASPRATQGATIDKWIVGGRAAAILAGAFSASSNHIGPGGDTTVLGGTGWIIGPNGEVLALTSREQPFATVEIDLSEAEKAKNTYPRYVFAKKDAR